LFDVRAEVLQYEPFGEDAGVYGRGCAGDSGRGEDGTAG
jgi:hypothetical protein